MFAGTWEFPVGAMEWSAKSSPFLAEMHCTAKDAESATIVLLFS